jgi:hypothetical protein
MVPGVCGTSATGEGPCWDAREGSLCGGKRDADAASGLPPVATTATAGRTGAASSRRQRLSFCSLGVNQLSLVLARVRSGPVRHRSSQARIPPKAAAGPTMPTGTSRGAAGSPRQQGRTRRHRSGVAVPVPGAELQLRLADQARLHDSSHSTPEHASDVAHPWPSVKQPTVHTDRPNSTDVSVPAAHPQERQPGRGQQLDLPASPQRHMSASLAPNRSGQVAPMLARSGRECLGRRHRRALRRARDSTHEYNKDDKQPCPLFSGKT